MDTTNQNGVTNRTDSSMRKYSMQYNRLLERTSNFPRLRDLEIEAPENISREVITELQKSANRFILCSNASNSDCTIFLLRQHLTETKSTLLNTAIENFSTSGIPTKLTHYLLKKAEKQIYKVFGLTLVLDSFIKVDMSKLSIKQKDDESEEVAKKRSLRKLLSSDSNIFLFDRDSKKETREVLESYQNDRESEGNLEFGLTMLILGLIVLRQDGVDENFLVDEIGEAFDYKQKPTQMIIRRLAKQGYISRSFSKGKPSYTIGNRALLEIGLDQIISFVESLTDLSMNVKDSNPRLDTALLIADDPVYRCQYNK
eukprot:snap_masked-scaffold_49-processed-gene-0.29-mRNA-1 protein AED:1.00 eAED:1.00 QI:0/0/0/0/1/1/2/0/313